MNQPYFTDFAAQLRSFREAQGVSLQSIAIVTRLNQDFLKRLESGDFEFASDVYIRGYLRKYAAQVGLDPDAIIGEFDSILQKIDFVERDDHAEAPPEVLADAGFTGTPADGNGSNEEIRTELDQAVFEKLAREKRVHSLVTWTATGLIVLALFQIVLTSGNNPSASPTETEEVPLRATSVQPMAPGTRPKLVLSAPIVPPKEKLLREAYAERLLQERMEREKNLQNDEWKGDGPVPRITVHEAARDLESIIRQ